MTLTQYKNSNFKCSNYLEVTISDLVFDDNTLTIQDNNDYGNLIVTDNLRNSICKYVGMSSSIDKGLYSTDKDLWYKVLAKLYSYYSKDNLILNISESNAGYYVNGICNSSKAPLSSKDFIDGVIRYYEDFSEISVYDIKCLEGETVSEVLLSINTEIYKDFTNKSFKLGVVFRNDELSNCYCRMAIIYDDGVVYYLPSKYYNLTTSRYDRSTSDNKEALDILLLRVSEDTASGYFNDKSEEILDHLSYSSHKNLSLMEYDNFKTLIQNISVSSDLSDEEINDISNSLDSINDFETIYGPLKNDYLWKCTAIGSFTLHDLLKVAHCICKEHVFYPKEDILLREFLGDYLVTPRNCQLLAKKL